jgi:hypothetical protein
MKNLELNMENKSCPYCGYEGSDEELEECCDEAQADGFNNQEEE